MKPSLLLIFIIIVTASSTNAYKILVVFPFPARSHNNLGNGFVKHLLKAGHTVTYITPFPLSNPDPNLHQIDVSSNRNSLPDNSLNINTIMNKEGDNLNDEKFMFLVMQKVIKKTFENGNLKKLLNDQNQRFDVIVAEWMFTEVFAGFSAVFECPFIWSNPYEPFTLTMALIDDYANPAYIPNLKSNNVPPYGFLQRVEELWSQIYSIVLKKFSILNYEKEMYKEFFGPVLDKRGRQLPDFEVLRLNASMTLGNLHYSMGTPMSHPQSFKYIGGFHIDDKVEPLPQKLQNIMDNSKHGVIYFSLGSNLKSKDLAMEIKIGLIKVMGELKQTVIWKYEEDLPTLPKNVHIMKWAPQQSILAHPNCILFITHGGLLSMMEVAHFGVPIIGIPVFVDQFNNIDRMVIKGVGKRVDLSYELAKNLKDAIVDITSNTRYLETAKALSTVYHDRVVPPGRELVHWVEHVARTRGAPHLRSPATLLPWYQKYYIDLAALILAILYATKLAIVQICLKKKRDVKKKKH